MKPGTFAYHCPRSEDEALVLLADSGDAKVLAGGQSLVPAMNFRLARPTVLVDLNRIASLSYITEEPSGGLRIGAMTRQRAIERSPVVAARASLLAEAMPWIAHAQIRNRGTIGGSLAHADPAAELPAVMVALGAQFTVRSRAGTRGIAADRFYTGLFTTALQPGEVLVSIEIPPRSDALAGAPDRAEDRFRVHRSRAASWGFRVDRRGCGSRARFLRPVHVLAHRALQRRRRAGGRVQGIGRTDRAVT